MLPKILTVDFNANQWTLHVRRSDGRRCQAVFTPDAFLQVKRCPLGQILLQVWLGRADPLPGAQPSP